MTLRPAAIFSDHMVLQASETCSLDGRAWCVPTLYRKNVLPSAPFRGGI